MTRRPTVSLAIPIAFGCVYFFWGSTYTAIKVGVQYLHPLVLGGARFLIAGMLMLAFCILRGMQVRLPLRQIGWLAVIGIVLLGGGNIGLVFGERYIASGLAALLVAVMPLYVAVLSMLLPRGEKLQGRGWAGLGLGFASLIALLWPGLHQRVGGMQQTAGCVIVLAAAFLWAVGSILSRELKLPVNPMVAAGWQMLAAGIFSSLAALTVNGWQASHWTRGALGAVAYLVTFGSLVGYTGIRVVAGARSCSYGGDICVRQPCGRCNSRRNTARRASGEFRICGHDRGCDCCGLSYLVACQGRRAEWRKIELGREQWAAC